ncbi:hypothetical protein OSTOST_01315 [Ostertagia ostertagi]
MLTVSACKANLTKALTALDSVQGRIPAFLLNAIDAQVSDGDLDAIHASLVAHLTQRFAALRTVKERRQAIINLVEREACIKESRAEDAIAAAEDTAGSLHVRLSEVNLRIETSISTLLPRTAQKEQQEISAVAFNARNNSRPFILPQRSLGGQYGLDAPIGEAQVVLQDLGPDECNYFKLVKSLKRRYDRPYKTRATLHRQLQRLSTARNSGPDLRNTWSHISGILHGLPRY